MFKMFEVEQTFRMLAAVVCIYRKLLAKYLLPSECMLIAQ